MTARRPLLALLLMAASAGPAAAALRPGAPSVAIVFLVVATVAASAQLLPRPVRILLRPGFRSVKERAAARALVPAALVLAGAFGFPSGSLLVALLPAAGRGLMRRRWHRDLRTARDALGVALLDLLLEGDAVSLLGAAATVFLLAIVLPGVLSDRAGGRPGRWAGPGTAFATMAVAAILFVGIPRPTRIQEEPSASRHRERRARQESALPRGDTLVSMPDRQVRLGEIGTIQRDFRPRLEVAVHRGGRPADAEDLGPLFRGGSLEEFDGRTWSASDRRVVLRDADDGTEDGMVVAFPRMRTPQGAERIVQRLRLLSGGTDTLYCLGMPVAVGGPGAEGGVAVHPRGEVRSVENYAEGARFTIVSYAVPGSYPVLEDETLGRARREALLALPPGHGRVRDLGLAALGKAPPGRGKLRALGAFLRARCGYSLEIGDPGGLPPVDSFLFSSRRGHCELFATAAALMLRADGIPARVAIGFRGGVYDAVAAKYTLRGADAHAWVEAWFEDEGWITFDPTPAAPGMPAEEAAEEEEPAAKSGGGWLQRLLRFDGAARDRLLGAIGNSLAAVARNTFVDGGGRARLGTLSLLAAGIALLVTALRLRRRGTPAHEYAAVVVPGLPPSHPPPEAYAILLGRLAEAGIRRGPAETSREHAGRALRAGASPPEIVERVVTAFEAERWGGRPPAGAEATALAEAARGVVVGQ